VDPNTGFPICQENAYNYFIYDCKNQVFNFSTNPPPADGSILQAPSPCGYDRIPFNTCLPYLVIAVDPTNNYDDACFFTGHFIRETAEPQDPFAETIQMSWSGCVGWLKDRRSHFNFVDALDNPQRGRVLLLGANQTV
jgi:hypothetical protein